MSLLSTGSVQGDRVVFQQDFLSRRYVQDYGGVLVGCNVGLRGPGIIPTAATSRVTYDKTQSTLVNANKMTVRLNFRTSASAIVAQKLLMSKTPIAFNDNQFHIQQQNGGFLAFLVANAAGDGANYIITNAGLAINTSHVAHLVYDGTLAVGSRAIIYLGGSVTASTINGTIPAAMRAGASPLCLFQFAGGVANAPPTDFTLFDAKIWAASLSAAEVQDDALNKTFSVTP